MVTSLVARGVVLDYDGAPPLRALAGVDIALAAGELVCVLGPNGCGKSTLLAVLGGILAPSSGSVELDGRPIASVRSRERARAIASVPQVLRALPEQSVEAFVLGGRYPHLGIWGRSRAGDREAVQRALDEAHAGGLSERGLNELSGGQCQRVLVARALAQEARLLLFDEPTASLDPEHQVLVFELIARLARDAGEERAALVATHELSLASRYADRIVLLDAGRVVAQGTPDEVLRPAVLGPVYGRHLHYGTGPDGKRPLVVPWPAAGSSPISGTASGVAGPNAAD